MSSLVCDPFRPSIFHYLSSGLARTAFTAKSFVDWADEWLFTPLTLTLSTESAYSVSYTSVTGSHFDVVFSYQRSTTVFAVDSVFHLAKYSKSSTFYKLNVVNYG